jgi:hypothetical protein
LRRAARSPGERLNPSADPSQEVAPRCIGAHRRAGSPRRRRPSEDGTETDAKKGGPKTALLVF